MLYGHFSFFVILICRISNTKKTKPPKTMTLSRVTDRSKIAIEAASFFGNDKANKPVTPVSTAPIQPGVGTVLKIA